MSRRKAHGLDRVLDLVMREPWAVTRPMLGIIAHVLARRLGPHPVSFDMDDEEFERRPPGVPKTEQGIALIPIHGVIAPRMNAMTDISGGATFEQATAALAEAVAHNGVKTIVLDIDSPGGSVAGATEFAKSMLAARKVKPIIAVANHCCCSAAYWFAACATEIVATPSASVGSIGVYSMHEDLTGAMEQAGVKMTVISAGKHKTDCLAGLPLTEDGRAHVQEQVDRCYTTFVNDVAAGRNVPAATVRSAFGEGAVVNSADALALGMVDRIGTLESTIAQLLTPGSSQARLSTTLLTTQAETTPALPADTAHEPSPATAHDRSRIARELQAAVLALQLS